MKIALVILHADPARGGAERYTTDLARALLANGDDATLIAATFKHVPAGVRQHKLSPRGLTRGGRYESFLDRLGEHLAERDYDVVHAMLPVRHCDVYHPHAGLAGAAVPAFSVATWTNPRRRKMAAVERELLSGEKPPVLLTLSGYVETQVRKTYPRLNTHTERLVNAVDLDKFTPAPLPPGPEQPQRALCVAQDFHRKGVVDLLDALQRLNHPALELVVVGKCDQAYWKKRAEQAGVGKHVTFAGHQSDVRPFYRSSSFFVLPTKHDPCSLVVLEALACGLPVITTRQNGAADVMTDGRHGIILDRVADTGRFVSALTHSFKQLLDPGTAGRMRAAVLELRPTLSYHHHLEKLLAVYDAVSPAPAPAGRGLG